MSMTREEAIERIKVLKARCERLALNSSRGFSEWKMDAEACEIAISALTPLTQEQMKELYPGCDFCKKRIERLPFHYRNRRIWGQCQKPHTPILPFVWPPPHPGGVGSNEKEIGGDER